MTCNSEQILNWAGTPSSATFHANKDAGASQPGHFGMANVIRLPTGHNNPKGLKRLLRQQFAKIL